MHNDRIHSLPSRPYTMMVSLKSVKRFVGKIPTKRCHYPLYFPLHFIGLEYNIPRDV